VLLEVVDVWKIFQKGGRKIIALQEISFNEDIGCVAVLGLNGAGKTTLFRLILGLLIPDRGSIIVEDTDPVKEPGRAAYPLLPFRDPRMTVSDAIYFIEMFFDVHVNEGLIELLKLEEHLDTQWQKLSEGYKKRLELLSAIVQDSKIVLLDEITNGLDVEAVDVFVGVINHIKKERLILFATHIFKHAEMVADRVLVLHRGKLLFHGGREDFGEDYESSFRRVVYEGA